MKVLDFGLARWLPGSRRAAGFFRLVRDGTRWRSAGTSGTTWRRRCCSAAPPIFLSDPSGPWESCSSKWRRAACPFKGQTGFETASAILLRRGAAASTLRLSSRPAASSSADASSRKTLSLLETGASRRSLGPRSKPPGAVAGGAPRAQRALAFRRMRLEPLPGACCALACCDDPPCHRDLVHAESAGGAPLRAMRDGGRCSHSRRPPEGTADNQFADGLTEALIGGNRRDGRRTGHRAHHGDGIPRHAEGPLGDIARELGVEGIIEGLVGGCSPFSCASPCACTTARRAAWSGPPARRRAPRRGDWRSWPRWRRPWRAAMNHEMTGNVGHASFDGSCRGSRMR